MPVVLKIDAKSSKQKKMGNMLKNEEKQVLEDFLLQFSWNLQGGGGWGSGCPPENKRGVEQKGFPYIPEVPPPHVQRDKWEGEGERKHRKQISHDSSPPLTRTDPSSNERTTVFVDR